ncbi:MAG: DUF4253 domain-containing protein [Candidatus Melainabacteria bacterium]|nr:DUF4253 domain-containing protein [Candidatus Melainabacteria bacterium]MBX9673016.1 DUF4253 domain-containing protein [Candidatus Obscuribacterales bacterium]
MDKLKSIFASLGLDGDLRRGPSVDGEIIPFIRIPKTQAFKTWRSLATSEMVQETGFYPVLIRDETEIHDLVDQAWTPAPEAQASYDEQIAAMARTFGESVEQVEARMSGVLKLKSIENCGLSQTATIDDIVRAGLVLPLIDWFDLRRAEYQGLVVDQGTMDMPLELKPKQVLDLLRPEFGFSGPSISGGGATPSSGLDLGLNADFFNLFPKPDAQPDPDQDPYLITSISHKITESEAQPTGKCVLAMIKVAAGHHVPAFFRFGGYNACPPPTVHTACLYRWQELYRAQIAVIGHDTLEIVLPEPPGYKSLDSIKDELFLYCPDIVEQGFGDLRIFKRELDGSTVWSFWWD